MKKVCVHYISTYLPLTENWIFTLLKNLINYEPLVLSREQVNLDRFPIPKLVSLSDLGRIRYFYNFAIFKTRNYFPFFKKTCNYNNARILHIHFGYHGIKSIGLKRQLKIPMVCSFYGNDAYINRYDGKYFEMLKMLFKEADKILTLGPQMSLQLERLGCPEKKIAIHHLGVNVKNIDFKQRFLPKNNKLRFLIACSFVYKKGIDDVLKALKLIKKEIDFTLDIIGDGYLNNEIRTLMTSLKLDHLVTFHGYQSYPKIIGLAYKSHILLQASKTSNNNDKEGTPIIFADVMATGLPVVSTFHSDIPEVIKNGVTGFLGEEGNPENFSNAILNLIQNHEIYEECSIQSRLHIEKEFNDLIQNERLEAIYNQL